MRVVVVVRTGSSTSADVLQHDLSTLGVTVDIINYKCFAQCGACDLLVLFGLTPDEDTAFTLAWNMRALIGPKAGFLIISSWRPEVNDIAIRMQEAFGAEYLYRLSPSETICEKVRAMLGLSKTAPS